MTTTSNTIQPTETTAQLQESRKPGYQKSKLGRIPVGWFTIKFEELAYLVKNTFDPKNSENSKCIELENIEQGTGRVINFMDSQDQASTKFRFKKNYVLFGKLRPYLKKFWLATFSGVCSSEIWVFRANNEYCADKFLFYLIQSHKFIQKANISSGTKMPRANWQIIAKSYFAIPPLPEQRQIAEILSTWDRAIEKTEQLIAAKEKRKKGLMQQLLTGKIRFAGFKEQKWESFRLKDITEINPNKPQIQDESANVSFIRMADLSEKAKVTQSHIKKYSQVKNGFTSFEKDDVIIAKITPCFENGKGALLEDLKNKIGFGSTEFHVLRPKENINKHYLFYHTLSHRFRELGEANMTGSAGQKRVPKDFLENFKIPVPSLQEQQKIASVLNACDREVEQLKDKLDKLKEQKRGLMQSLLSGKIRTITKQY